MVARYLTRTTNSLRQTDLEGMLYHYKASKFLINPQLNSKIALLLQDPAKRGDELLCLSRKLVLESLVLLRSVFSALFVDELLSQERKDVKLHDVYKLEDLNNRPVFRKG